MSQQSDTADAIYERLTEGPFPLAELVRELHEKWGPDHSVPEVHRFAEEVAALLLRHDDVEVGDVEKERFVRWQLESWDSEEMIAKDLMSAAEFLEDESRYVFRKKRPNPKASGDAGKRPVFFDRGGGPAPLT